jgi:hypothetical protein
LSVFAFANLLLFSIFRSKLCNQFQNSTGNKV